MRLYFGGLVTAEQFKFAERVASGLGLETDEYIRRILDEGFKRAEHVERCRPKVAGESGRDGGQIGRPIGNTSSERVLVLAKSLRRIYAKLRESHGEGFEQLFGNQDAELERAIRDKDAGALEEIEREKKWILRKW